MHVMNTGLSPRDINTIHSILSKYSLIKTVLLFGSRAKGNYKQGSDIDLAIMNEGLEVTTIQKIIADFEDSTLPYFTDIVNYNQVREPSLREHIDRVGIKIFERN